MAEQWQLENNCSSFQFGFENYSVLWWNAVSMTTDYFLNAGTIEGWWEYLFSFLQWCTRAHLCSVQNIWCVPFALVFMKGCMYAVCLIMSLVLVQVWVYCLIFSFFLILPGHLSLSTTFYPPLSGFDKAHTNMVISLSTFLEPNMLGVNLDMASNIQFL